MAVNELVWLLLPVAAASGWWAARRTALKASERRARTTPAYFRGLNYLLNEEPDKAIDVFVRLLEVDSETVEIHLALGSLFRRRGEVERAIRIHQNLIARSTLDDEQRANALLELGMDYMRAGLFDRAENLFLELKEARQHMRQALQNLLIVYQQERDWRACLKVTEELEPLVSERMGLARSHYYCELAEQALRKKEPERANDLLKKARREDPDCVRSLHLQARLAMEALDCPKAIELLREVAEQDPGYLPEILGDLRSCHARLGDLAGLRSYLEERLKDAAEVDIISTLSEIIMETEGEGAALAFMTRQMEERPTIRGLLSLIELNSSMPDVRAGQILVRLKDHMERLLAERPPYQCNKCGYSAKTMHWQCPSCRSWSTIRRKTEPQEICR